MNGEIRRRIKTVSSFGGQAPFLSMLTYATAALLLALFFSPIVLIIGGL